MDNWNVLEMIFRSTLIFSLLLLFTRLMGRKQLSQLTFFNYITGIALGSIAANTTLGKRDDMLDGITSLVWWATLTLLVGWMSLKSSKFRLAVDGQPVIIIKKGDVLKKQLKKLRLNMDDVQMLLRQQNVFSIQDVEYAIFESTGTLSVLLKEEQLPVTRKDQHIPVTKVKYLPTQLISDGKFLYDNIRESGITLEWLEKQMNEQNISQEDILFAELQKDGSLYISRQPNV